MGSNQTTGREITIVIFYSDLSRRYLVKQLVGHSNEVQFRD